MAETQKIQAFVIREVEVGEYESILTLLSSESVYSCKARGLRKPLAKNRSATNPFVFSEFLLSDNGRSLLVLQSAKLLESYHHVLSDFNTVSAASLLNEWLSSQLYHMPLDAPFCFELLETCLKLWHQGHDAKWVLSLAMVSLLAHNGVVIHTEGCVLCGEKKVTAISVKAGGFLCERHRLLEGIEPLESNSLKQFRWLNHAGFKNLEILEKEGEIATGLLGLLGEYMVQYTGIKETSLRLLKLL
ncbi:MAG: DNA repair protein RecO [Erysipelotrichaceae bacterium]|nr:DNA repair protein RecO [Erysipelotrichaceae bacterium]